MAAQIKITQLTDIGSANIATTTVLPVVNMAGVATTQKTTLGNLANVILSQSGSNYARAANANIAYSVANAAQPNITSVGTLTTLTVSGNTNLGAVGNVKITGGTAGQILSTDGAGNLSWVSDANGGSYGNSNVATFLASYGSNTITTTGNVSVGNIIGNGQALTGIVAANITGLGNLATANFDGNSSNVLHGDGTWSADVTNYGNSNVSTFLASYGSNTITTTGNVSVGNIIGNGQALTGIAGANVTGTVANANYALHVDVNPTTNNFSYHIVMVANPGDNALQVDDDDHLQYNPADGTLTTYRLDANILNITNEVASNMIPFSNVTYDLGNNTNRWKDIYLANSTIYLGDATISANGNSIVVDSITVTNGNVGTIGNVASLNLDGNSSHVLYGNGVFASIPVQTKIANGTSNVNITGTNGPVDVVASGNIWEFDGSLNTIVFPNNSNINVAGNNFNITAPSAGSIQFYTDNGNKYFTLDNYGFLNLPYAFGIGNSAAITSTQDITLQPAGGNTYRFNANGTVVFPTLTVDLHNGGNQYAQTLQFGGSGQQAVITGPTPDVDTNAERLIIQGQRGNGTGEGGDVYFWAGDADTNGGDIKIYAGDADNVSTGYGGYINLDGGSGFDNGGQVNITGGYSANGQGGTVSVSAGQGGTDGGAININGGSATANQGGNIALQAGYGGNNGGEVRLTGGSAGVGIPGYGNVVLVSGASTWTFDNGGNLTVPGEGIIQSINDTVILRSVDANSNIYSARLGTNGGLYFETTAYPTGWLSLTNNSGNANITAASGTAGGAGKNIYINAGDADQSDFYTSAGGNITITGGLGAFNDGGGGGPGGNINLTAGLSSDPAGHAGNINITSGSKAWTFDYTGNLALPTNGSIIVDGGDGVIGPVSDDLVISWDNEDIRLVSVQSSIEMQADAAFRVQTNYDGANVLYASRWEFTNNEIVNISNNFGIVSEAGNLNLSGGRDGVNSGNTTISAVATGVAVNTWTFDNTGNLTLAGGNSVIFSTANSSLDPTLPNVSTMTLTPDANYNSQVLVLDPTAPGHIHLRAHAFSNIDDPAANIFLGGEQTAFEVTSGPNNVAKIHSGGNTWAFGNDGRLTFPGTPRIDTDANNFEVQAAEAINFEANTVVNIYTDSGNTAYQWQFGDDGNLTLPGNTFAVNYANGTQVSLGGGTPAGSNNQIQFNSNGAFGASANYKFTDTVGGGAVEVGNELILTGNGTISTGANNLNIQPAGNLVVTASAYNWTFDIAGNLTLPGNTFAVNYANGTQVSLGSSYGDSNVVSLLSAFGSNTITTTGNVSVGNIAGSTNGYTLGYLNIPQVAASNTTLALGDAGKHYYSTTAGNLTLTIPNNATTSFATGTAISIVVQAAGNVLVNAASGVTLYMAGNSTAANRVVGTYGMATLMKVASDTWFINGTGVS